MKLFLFNDGQSSMNVGLFGCNGGIVDRIGIGGEMGSSFASFREEFDAHGGGRRMDECQLG